MPYKDNFHSNRSWLMQSKHFVHHPLHRTSHKWLCRHHSIESYLGKANWSTVISSCLIQYHINSDCTHVQLSCSTCNTSSNWYKSDVGFIGFCTFALIYWSNSGEFPEQEAHHYSVGVLVCMYRMYRSVHRDVPSVFVCIGMGARACDRHIPNVPSQTCRHTRDKKTAVAVSLATIPNSLATLLVVNTLIWVWRY